jgi:hypothetical protein
LGLNLRERQIAVVCEGKLNICFLEKSVDKNKLDKSMFEVKKITPF